MDLTKAIFASLPQEGKSRWLNFQILETDCLGPNPSSAITKFVVLDNMQIPCPSLPLSARSNDNSDDIRSTYLQALAEVKHLKQHPECSKLLETVSSLHYLLSHRKVG